ncbi:TPA: alanine--glyoxylate aminotransferase family protein [archaeon]|jgi:aspartate aminotransferase-like enzyme|uniref:Alanine--glyoxylate aminotransferase family protein n=1 Tax=Candidatus Undinarchaeum marinum TaxID=2756141 RepID=A0A832ULQ6_9ARCH|nr:alanine--glyoxylate aminotransferase family protein [Candidatus Undinarchaeum marinum]
MVPLLMTPGPTEVPERIRTALAHPIVHHRTPEFTEILDDCGSRLKKVFKTDNTVYTMSGSGTTAMCAALENTVSKGDKVLSIVFGKFSERFRDIALSIGADLETLQFDWGQAPDIEKIEEALDDDVKAVTMVHNETSTGVRADVEAVGKLVKDTNALFICDTISSMAGDNVETDNWNIDLCIAGSQKCFSMPPGIGFLSVSDKAWPVIESKKQNYLTDLNKYRSKYPQTPFTSPISLIFGLQEALSIIEEEGLDKRVQRHRENAEFTRTAVKELGLELYPASEDICSATLTSIRSDRAEEILSALKEKGILVAGAQAPENGKMFRIGHMGSIGRPEIERTLEALKEVLEV